MEWQDANALGLILKAQSPPPSLLVLHEPMWQRVGVWTYPNWVQQGSYIPVAFVNGDQLGARIEANGQVSVYRNGSLLGVRDVSGWPYSGAGGYIGLFNIGAGNAVLDDFGEGM